MREMKNFLVPALENENKKVRCSNSTQPKGQKFISLKQY